MGEPKDTDKNQDQDQGQNEGLPPIAEGIEDAVGSPPRETVSGNPQYAPDAEYAAHPDEESERRTP